MKLLIEKVILLNYLCFLPSQKARQWGGKKNGPTSEVTKKALKQISTFGR